MPPAIVVLVDGFTRLGGSQYVDSIHNGDYATYTVRDVVGHVDRTYRTIAAEGGRAVLGKSSGGFGAMHLVLGTSRRLRRIRFAQRRFVLSLRAFSGVRDGSAHARGARLRSSRAFVEAFERKHKRSDAGVHDDGDARLRRGLLAAQRNAPSISICPSIERPASCETTSSRAGWPSIPPSASRRTARELARLRLRYLDCGRRDEYDLDIGARVVAERIRDLGLDGSARGIRRRPSQRRLPVRNFAAGARRRLG